MATPAAILQVMVEANTLGATTALSKFDSKLRGVDKTTATATTRTSALGSATRTTGTRLASAARYAAGAAAAYLSIAQAKAAVTTTLELAKTTAGLNRNLGLTIERGSQWASVAKSRDIDTKALNMSFTTLSRRLTDAARGSDTALRSFEDIGVTEKEITATQGDFNKQLLLIADSFGEAEGGAKRQQAAQKLLGRGYQTLLPMFAEGSDSLKEQFGWAAKYGAELDQNTVNQQMNLTMALRESKVAWLGMQVTFATALTPALKAANKEFQKIGAIMADDKLTNAEKFRKVGNIIEKWADKAFDAFVKVLPGIIEKAGEAGPKIAAALAKGFLQSDFLGRAVIAGWIFGPAAGRAAWAALGKRSGATFGRGFVGGVAIGALLFGPELLTMAFNFGKKIGQELKRAINDWGVKDAVKDALSFGEKTHSEINVKATLAAGSLPIDQAVKILEKRGKTAKQTEQIIQKALGLSEQNIREHGETVEHVAEKSGSNWSDFGEKFARVARKVSHEGRSETGELSRGVVGNVGNMVNTASEGLNTLQKNTNNALSAFEVKKVSFSIEKAANTVGSLFKQRGGDIPGAGTGDKVPAMLEAGEYVLNKNAVSGIGKRNLDSINFGKYARFQKGGAAGGLNFALGPYDIPPIQYAADHAGGNSHVHVTGTTTPWVVALGHKLQSMGFMVGEHPAFGGVGGMHSPTGGHYDALAIDINSAADETQAEVASIARLLGGSARGLGAVADIARVILQGPDGMLKRGGQGALDKAWKGAKAFVSKQQPTGIAPSGLAGNVPIGPIQQMARQMVAQLWGGGQWGAFNELEMREAGWNPRAVNASSGAAGLAQALPPSKYPPGAWPYQGLSSAKLQLQWMMGYIQDRYGTPSGALAWHDAHNWYQKGGQVLNFGNGGTVPGPIGKPQAAIVHGGEHISKGPPVVNVYIEGAGMDELIENVRVEVTPGIVDESMRHGGRNLARGRQLAGRGGR